MKNDLPSKRHQTQTVLQAKWFKLFKEIHRPRLHSTETPGEFPSLLYKASIALILKSIDNQTNATTVQLITKMEYVSSYLNRP